jgi:purine nucleosidase
MPERRILLDTDIGSDVDDALALALVLASPELELVAVTTVAAQSELRARVAASLLALAGRGDLEVCAGESWPVLGGAERFNGFGHEADCVVPGAGSLKLGAESGPERIVRAAREVDGLEIVLIGPMTNLARALVLDPELPRRVAGLWIMGGHIREVRIGDFVCAPGIDYNLCSDPEASVAVLGAGFATTLVSADVTLQTWLRAERLKELRAAGPVAAELARQIEIWEPVQRQIFTAIGGQVDADNVAFLHDPLTVLALFDETALSFEDLCIVPTIERGILRTLEVDPAAGIGAPMRVATRVDASAAERAIAARLLSVP